VSPLNANEPHLIYNLPDWEGLDVKIYAPWQAYPNDIMTIRIIVEAKETLQNVTVLFTIYGSMYEGYNKWFRRLDARFVDLPLGVVEDQYFDVSIPESVDPGLLHGHIDCSWEVWRESSWEEQSIAQVLDRVTYLKNKPFEDLQVAYNQLNASYNSLLTSYDDLENSYNDLQANYSALLMNYNSLQSSFNSLQNDFNNLQTNYDSLNSTYYSFLSNYSSLQASFNELKSKYEFAGDIGNTRNLMYVFIETTVIFIATTIYFVRARMYSAPQKPKPK